MHEIILQSIAELSKNEAHASDHIVLQQVNLLTGNSANQTLFVNVHPQHGGGDKSNTCYHTLMFIFEFIPRNTIKGKPL